ncbi:MAG: AAA family ATPase, partial [Flavobacteriales bacterium]|nr:AAA family ATPase [Flavobacteriales bacterium]
ITVNGERIERLPLETIRLTIPRTELRGIGFTEDDQDVEVVLCWSEEAMEQLAKEPTLYQYFPMTKEAHGMAYVIHSNGLQKQAQRTELNADSPINARLFDRLVARVREEAERWMEEDPDRYRSLFKAILHSKFEAAGLKVLHEHVQQPLIDFIKEHVPTIDGRFLEADHVLVRDSKLSIPLEDFGIEKHWFHWADEADAPTISRAKDNARLGLKLATVDHLIRKVDARALSEWVQGLPEQEYDQFLKEMKRPSGGLKELAGLQFIRADGGLVSFNDLLKKPEGLTQLLGWYEAHPHLNEWVSMKDLELTLVEMTDATWNETSAQLLIRLTTKEARDTLIERLPRLVVEKGEAFYEKGFFHWWAEHMDEIDCQLVRRKLVLRVGEVDIGWNDALILEQIELPTPPNGKLIPLELDKILPGKVAPGQQEVLALREGLAKEEYHPDFLKMAFGRKQKSGKEELVGVGNRMVKELEGQPLKNGTQLLFAVLLRDQHQDWNGFDAVKVRARAGEAYELGGWWYYQAPVFMSDRYLLDPRYADMADPLGADWSPIKVGSCDLVYRPRLGGAFLGDAIKEELDESAQVAFADWLLKESQANPDALDLIGGKYRDALKKVLRGDPGDWVRADDAWTIEEERIPGWVLTWLGEDEARKDLFTKLGLHGPQDPVIAWRKALLEGGEDVAEGLERPENTRKWVVVQGGSETFTTQKQQVWITELVRELGKEPVLRARPELEERAKVCTDPVYVEWRGAGGEWQVFEFDGAELPVDLCAGEDALARAHGVKVIPARDGSKRLFVLAGTDFVDLLVQLYGKMDEAAWRSLREVYSKHLDRSKPKKKETDNRDASLKEQVQELKERQLAYAGNAEMSLAELLNALEWEYQSKLLARQEGKTIRFKEVREAEDGTIHLAMPSVDELPYELNMGRDPKLLGITLKLRNKGGAYQEVDRFELLGSSEGEVLVKIPEPPLTLKHSTVAMIEMEPEDFLLNALVNAWEEQAGPLDGDKSLVAHIRERAPGEQVGFIFGPPGTGKTTELAGRLIDTVRNSRNKVLVLTPTNNAADVLYERISDKAEGDLDVLRAVHRFGSNSKQVLWEDDLPVVVITTMHRFPFDAIANGPALNEVDWDQVVFDEASMAALPHALLPLFTLPPRTGEQDWGALGARFLFAGDPFQLPPVGLTPSLLDRIEADKAKKPIRGYSTENIYTLAGIDRFDLEEAPNLEGSWIHRLTTNYRSGRSIVELFSRSRYQSGVTSAKG